MALFGRKQDLSFLDNKEIHLLNAEVLLTQRCKLKCEHCLRGDGGLVDISDQTLNNFFENVKEIGNLCLGSGEPSLLPERVNRTLEIIKQK